jgi:hypothetical protein
MSCTAPTNDPADRALQRDEDAQYHRQMLHELAEMGMGIARALYRHAAAEPAAPEDQPAASAAAPSPAIAASAAFDRIARTVRRTIALARKLSDPAQPGPARQVAVDAQARRVAARERIIRDSDIEAGDAEALHADLCERPEEPPEELDDGPDLDPPDLDPDHGFDEQQFAGLLAAIARDRDRGASLANLTDAQLRDLYAPGNARGPRARAAHLPGASAGEGNTGQPKVQPKVTQPAPVPLNAQPTPGDPHPITAAGTGPPPAPA